MTEPLETYEDQVQRALDWVHPAPGIVELRPTNEDGKYQSGWYADRRKLVQDAADYYGRAMY